MSRTGIVCTIGPVSSSEKMLLDLAGAGMTVARLNSAHSNLEWHSATVRLIRETVPEVPIIFDIPGRKIRTAALEVEPRIEKGDILVITTAWDVRVPDKIPVNYPTLHEEVTEGNVILADDGAIRLSVVKVEGRDIHCRVEVGGVLRSRKGINVPCLKLQAPRVTDEDIKMLGFARDQGIDFVGMSFVESAKQIEIARECCGEAGPRIVSKIESQAGLDHLSEIVAATDAIMIDRGDLSLETHLEQVTLFQKQILEAAKADAKPVIVATEMLHSMIENPYPTLAEISDITNSILDGVAATMLSGETAIGAHPVQAVKTMKRVGDAVMNHLNPSSGFALVNSGRNVPEAMEEAIDILCRQLAVTKIVAITATGYAARRVANRRPTQPILAVTNNPNAARSFNLLPGTEGFYVDIPFRTGSTDHIIRALEALWRKGKISNEDLILVTAVGYPRPGNLMNLIQTHRVADLVAMDWGRN